MKWVDPGHSQLQLPLSERTDSLDTKYLWQNIKPAQRLEYLNFGHAFMSSFYNMQRSAFQYALLHWSICQDPVYEE